MEKPKVAATSPKMVELIEGEIYTWCACGLSGKQPWCDGSHNGTAFSPKVFKAEESGVEAICMCKHTKNAPYCDGSHMAFE